MEPKIIGNLKLINSKIVQGKSCTGNVIFCDNTHGDVILEKSILSFNGSNGLIYIVGGGAKSLKILATANNDTSLYIGHNSSFHKSATIHLACCERQNIIIGDDCMFSRDIFVRTGDSHCIYSSNTHHRINHPKTIIIGDHVWIGQDVMILKGAQIGSGAIIGIRSLVPSKQLYSNTIYGGSPVKMLGDRGAVFFAKPDLNSCTEEQQKNHEYYESDEFIFSHTINEYYNDKIIDYLSKYEPVSNRIVFFQNLPHSKNRFAI